MDELTKSGRRSVIVGFGCIAVSGLSLVLRYVCKSMIKSGYHIDDVWILLTLLSYYGAASVNIYGIYRGGGGREMLDMLHPFFRTPESEKLAEKYALTRFIALTLSVIAVYTVKMSLLSFYRRIFDTIRYRRASLVMMVISTLWVIGTLIANFLVCIPIYKFWRPFSPGQCSNYSVFFIGSGTIETVIDIIILVLPIQMVLSIKLPRRNKIILSTIFMVGIFVAITNIIRVSEIYSQGNVPLPSFAKAEVWTNVHIATSIVCACAVTYKPLWGALAGWFNHIRSAYSSSKSNSVTLPTFIHDYDDAPANAQKAGPYSRVPSPPADAMAKEMSVISSVPISSYRPPTNQRPPPNLDKQLPPLIRGPENTLETHSGRQIRIEHPHMPRGGSSRTNSPAASMRTPPPTYSRSQSPSLYSRSQSPATSLPRNTSRRSAALSSHAPSMPTARDPSPESRPGSRYYIKPQEFV